MDRQQQLIETLEAYVRRARTGEIDGLVMQAVPGGGDGA